MRLLVALALLLGCTACLAPQDTGTARPDPTATGPTGTCAAARRAPEPQAKEQRLMADLDGDQRMDEVVSWLAEGGRVVQAWLATGETAEPQQLFNGELLSTHDVNRDGRAEVFVTHGLGKGRALVLDGCALAAVKLAVAPRLWEYAVGPTAALLCRPNGLVEEIVTQGRSTTRRAWTLRGGDAVGARPLGSGPVGDYAGRVACGT